MICSKIKSRRPPRYKQLTIHFNCVFIFLKEDPMTDEKLNELFEEHLRSCKYAGTMRGVLFEDKLLKQFFRDVRKQARLCRRSQKCIMDWIFEAPDAFHFMERLFA